MSLSYLDIATLKTERADLNKSLRWVESVLAWYQSDPLSIATGDNDTVVVPNTGAGRWLKQNSRANVVQGLTSQILTTSTTVSAGTKNYCDTTSGALTITLPASPPTGSLVSIFALAGTSLINKITLNPNGANINGVSGNREITVLQDFIDLEFVTGSGWIIKGQTNTSVLKTPTTAYTVSNPLTLPNYTGIINYLGRQKNTTTYQNPTNNANGRAIRCVVSVAGGNSESGAMSGGGGQVSNLFTGAASTIDVYANSRSTINSGAGIWIDFLTSSVRASAIQYSMTDTSVRWSQTRPKRMIIFGANTFNFANTGGVSFNYGVGAGEANNCILQGFEDLTPIATLSDVSLSSEWTLLSGQYHRLLNINSSKFFRHYIIFACAPNFFSTNNSFIFVNQLEFFGDVVAV